MKLYQFEVFDFQSVRSSNPIRVGDITCLLGKNEAGKTALLKALYRLNPLIEAEGEYDIVDDYPRSEVEEYEYEIETGERKPAMVARAVFELEADDIEPIVQNFGADVLNQPTLTVSKGYDNHRAFHLDVNQDAAFKYFVQHADVPVELKNAFYESTNFESLAEVIRQNAFHEQLKDLGERVNEIIEQGLDRYLYLNFLRPRLPKFVYFDEYYQLQGHENLDALKQRAESGELKPSDHAMLGLLSMARLNIGQLLNPRRTQLLINKLEGAGMNISKQMFNYWSQNQSLHVKFDVRPAHPEDPDGADGGTILWASVFDPYRSHSTLLGARSRGFVWFFSFLAWYSQLRQDNEPVILLLDEPGLSLHARAQLDLLRFFEEQLKPHHQLLYSTHSPFMIDPAQPDQLRFVEDRSSDLGPDAAPKTQGTKVTENAAEASAETLAPLENLAQAPLENLTQTPSVETLPATPPRQCQLLVEDVADLFFLRAMSLLLEQQDLGLNNEWVIVPVGGIEQIPTYINQANQGPDAVVALLVNTREQDRDIYSAFLGKQLLAENNIRTLSDFAATQEAAVEDLFDVVFYTNLVNAAYRGYLSQPIAAPDLGGQSSVRLRDRVREYLAANPLQGGIHFNHRRPARLFADNARRLEGEISQQSKDRFAGLFAWLNELLSDPVPVRVEKRA